MSFSFRSLLGGILAGTVVLTPLALVANEARADAAPADVSCGASSTPVEVHYVASADPGHLARIAAVDLSGFDSGCEGARAVFQLWGNPAGDPLVPQSGDSLLATLDSTLDPCTQRALAEPLTVQGGVLNLTLCPTGGPAGEIGLHDLTLVDLIVNGQTVPVATSSVTPPRVTSAPAVIDGVGALAFTGTDLERLVIAGAAALLLGSMVAILSSRRERRRRPHGSGTE